MISPLTVAFAMFVAGVSFLFRPVSPNNSMNLITAICAAVFIWGAAGIMIVGFWRASRRVGR
jgi:hypothetical protein